MSPQSSPVDAALLAECEVDTYRASGPGGQKRNKTESAVRIRHRPTGIIVIAEESRSQAENRVRALRRLHEALALRVRHPVEGEGASNSVKEAIDGKGRLKLGRRDARYLPAAGSLLDLLEAAEGRVSTVAERLGLTTGNVSAFLTADDDLMAATNHLRSNYGLKPLRRD